jgi:hypothetical protein
MGSSAGVFAIMSTRDLALEQLFPVLRTMPYTITSPKDPRYNCVAFAVGDLTQFWYDVNINGYYWPPGARSADTIDGWTDVFELHGYRETTDRSLEPEYEKIAIYVSADVPEHVARQKAHGKWTSKAGKGRDFEHELEALEGSFHGKVVKVMRRKCQGGRRVLE